MNILLKVKNKINNVLHRIIFRHFGYGKRVSKKIWEEQFGDHTWDYLNSKDEEGHYYAIVNFYKQFNNSAAVLDIGCGTGVLYNYFKKVLDMSDSGYKGIDISENAVKGALEQFPNADFEQLDFEHADAGGKYDIIVFNETLYYFKRPLKILEKCIQKNLNPGGCFIISMCDNVNPGAIWRQISEQYKTVFEDEVSNNKGYKWKIKLIQPV